MTLREFITRYGITIACEQVDSNPNMQDANGMFHWRCRLRCKSTQRVMSTYFSMGGALTHEPTAEDVLNCLSLDAGGVDNASTFESWASEYGYDPDSRKAERTYNVIRVQASALRRFCASKAIYDTLLACEPL
jgi:hypothetical protein